MKAVKSLVIFRKPLYAWWDTVTTRPGPSMPLQRLISSHTHSRHVHPKHPQTLFQKPDVNTFTHTNHYYFSPIFWTSLAISLPPSLSTMMNQEMEWKSEQPPLTGKVCRKGHINFLFFLSVFFLPLRGTLKDRVR
ncbi:hypothetical protein NPIL_382991 [Nephila pilipes]|uniref:Uncharacterized protein n=1 Tax=Nephila pilipes TaxID=299642 RepID=A0A8X6UJV7_NEPPI|nr:hypothetical protein NPIL_382991 [Nephila pilipes]